MRSWEEMCGNAIETDKYGILSMDKPSSFERILALVRREINFIDYHSSGPSSANRPRFGLIENRDRALVIG